MKYNIIFLDIDGVLNSYNTISPDISNGIKALHFDEISFNWFLMTLKDIKNIKVVISSTWRLGSDTLDSFFEFCDKMDASRMRELEPFIHEDWRTKRLRIYGSMRGDEVKEWLNRHKKEINKYIILDDDSDFYKNQPLLKIDGCVGYGFLENQLLKVYFDVQNKETDFAREKAYVKNLIDSKKRHISSVLKIMRKSSKKF